MKKILLFTTGGTIASKEGNNGLEPEMDANELLSYMGDLANRYDITCRELLSLDSSNIQAEEWRKIARNIFENLEQYDGIVVTHGTDTMAYTASMLSFMLQNLKVPVVLTGSQMPIDNMPVSYTHLDVYKRQTLPIPYRSTISFRQNSLSSSPVTRIISLTALCSNCFSE